MQRILFSLIVFFPIFTQADPRSEYLQTDLDAYVHKDDASFNYVTEKVQEFDGYFIHSIRMDSQNFLQTKDVNKTSWSHWLTVIEPVSYTHLTLPTILLV